MFRRIGSIVLIIFFLAAFIGIGIASGKADGNARKGKYLFRKNCRSCHQEGGSAKDLSPVDKTQADWTAAFAKDAQQSLACKAEWEKQSASDITDIYTYMHDHAFDSPSPAKCK
ncbi:MAG: cytochrome c [Desulfobacteraceae bacterium]|nr:MAG: cytochrome c [Desulfobacteraceae bacterium]